MVGRRRRDRPGQACRDATRPRRGGCAPHRGLAGSSTAARNAAMASATASGARLGRWWPAPGTSCRRASGRARASRQPVSTGTRASWGSASRSTGRWDGRDGGTWAGSA